LIPFKTYPFQDDCIDDFVAHRFNVILKSRQLGISTLSAAYSVWLALFYRDKSILVIATKMAVAVNFIRKVKVFIKNLPPWLVLPKIVADTQQKVEFSNGSSIKAIPTSDDAGRSEALSLLIVDEAAFIRNFKEIWKGVYSTLQTGGRAIVLSTPNGVGGQYYDLYVNAEQKINKFNAIKLPWYVHPDHDQEWYDEEIKNMTPKQAAQELDCDFAASGDTYFQATDIQRVTSATREPIEKWGVDRGVWVWAYPQKGKKYIIAADVSRGDPDGKNDPSAFHVIDVEASEQVAEFVGHVQPDRLAIILAEASRRYNDAEICVERNTYGHHTMTKLRDEGHIQKIWYEDSKIKFAALYGGDHNLHKAGFDTQTKTRLAALAKLEEAIRNKRIIIHSKRTASEMKTFVYVNKKPQSMRGRHDDLILSLAIGLQLYELKGEVKSDDGSQLAMGILAAMGVNRTEMTNIREKWEIQKTSFKPHMMHPDSTQNLKKTPFGDFTWMLK